MNPSAFATMTTVDVPPPWYELSAETCTGDARRCGGGDVACRRQAEKDGYVAVSLYEFCRKDDVHTIPRPAGVVVLLGLLALGGAAVRRARRRA